MISLFLQLLFTILLFSHLISAQPSSKILLIENFRSYQSGSNGNPTWSPTKGLWQVIDHTYVQQSDEYDCTSLLEFYLNESFTFEATFEHISGELGVGVIFSSYERSSTQYAEMVRFDGASTIMTGYFQNGEFNATSSAKTEKIDLKKKHTLLLTVDHDNNVYTLSIDGHILKENLPLTYLAGYCGLQSSGGRVRIHTVKLTRTQMRTKPPDMNWVKQFTLSPTKELFIPNEHKGTIQRYSPLGHLLQEIGTPALSGGQLHQPSAVAFLDSTTLIVTDRGSNQLHLFQTDGKWLRSTGWKGKEQAKFDHPIAVTSNGQRQIFVLEKNNNRVQVFNDSLQVITDFGNDKLIEPLDLAIVDSVIYIVNTGLSQIECYTWDGKKAKWNNSINYGGGEGRGIGVFNRTIYLSLVNEVRAYDTNGTILNRFFGRSMNFILPWHITTDNNQDIYFADFFRGRIVRTTKDLLDPTPQVTFPNPTTALIEAESNQDTPFELIIENINGTIVKHIQSTGTFTHELRVDGLLPSTIYHYKYTPTLGTIPPIKAFTRYNSFITPPVEKNDKHYTQVRMVALIFANVIDDRDSSKAVSEQPFLSDLEIDRIKGQLSDAVKFYWIHSSMNLFLDLEPIIISDRLQRNTLYGQEWWYPPKEEVIKKYLTLHEKQISDYAAILYLTCTQSYDSTSKRYVLAGKGGAFTNGVGTGKGYGISWWDVTKKNHNAGNNWLMVHEFNHQLDDVFLASGYPEYWFNHISPTIGTAAKFGEHFDANAYILRSVPKEEWFDLLYSTHRLTRDTDHDGIPDNDPRLPLDEVRLGSDSTKIDTDDDGISDFQELFFSNWLIEGWGETWGGQPLFPNLQSHDTDNDNIPDGKDILPCSPIPSSIRRGSLMIDDAIPKIERLKFYDFHDDRINASIYAAWQDSILSFVLELDRDVPIKLMLDANSDGWFLGRDNFLITLSSREDSLLNSQVQIFNCTQPNRWPFMDQTLSNQFRLKSSLKKIGGNYVITLNISKNNSLGLSLTPNEQISLLIGFLCPFDEDRNKRYLTIFEPNRFIDLHLSSD